MVLQPRLDMHSILEIKSFCLPVYIGNTQEEQKKPQNIQFDIKISFMSPPNGEQNDTLEGVVCYNMICEKIRSLITNKKFFLIEKLAGDILKELKQCCPSELQIQVCVQKLKTPIKDLKGSVSYTCGDLF